MVLLNLHLNNNESLLNINYTIDDSIDDITILKQDLLKLLGIPPEDITYKFMINHSVPLTLSNVKKYIDEKYKVIDISINYRLNGGIIDSIIDMLDVLERLFAFIITLLDDFTRIFTLTFEMLLTVFDPPKLINDIIYAFSASISIITDYLMKSVDYSTPKTESDESAIFGINKKDANKTCISPTLAMILMLIVCPPVAIFYKYNFWSGLLPAIICGVLCVKLYYFPGLLFAALIVLC